MEQQENNQRIEERKGQRQYSNIIVAMWRWGFENDCEDAVKIDTLEDVTAFIGKRFRSDAWDSEPNIKIHVKGKASDLTDKYVYFVSAVYATDDNNGVCADGDPLSVRYRRIDNGRVFKMKCGKFFRRLVDETHPELPESGRVYFSEQLSAMYRAGHAQDGRYRLTLDRDFETIYSGHHFGSCMAGKGQWKFYRDSSPDTLAAGLWDGDNLVARCVVYLATDDETGKTYRLAERQYGGNSEVRRQLIYLLIEQNKIDGYKQLEASCWDNRNFVLLDGTSLKNAHLSVKCTACDGDVQSFQDSFRYLDTCEGVARNWEGDGYDADMACTNPYVNENDDDSDEDDHDGEIYVEHDGEWYNEDDVCWLDYRNEYRHNDDCRYSECEERDLLAGDTTRLYNGDYCHDNNAVEIEAGEHYGEYAYTDDSNLVQDYASRYVLRQDCMEITCGQYPGSIAPEDEIEVLAALHYGTDAYAITDETVETEDGNLILMKDSAEVNGCIYHKDDVVLAADRRFRRMVYALPEDCVLISGTYYLMCLA